MTSLNRDLFNNIFPQSKDSTADLFGNFFHGSRAKIYVNGKLYGFAFGVTVNIQTQHDEIWTIDDYTPYELAPNKIQVNGTLSQFHVVGRGPSKELIQANALSFLFHKYITLEIRDSKLDITLFKSSRVMITGRNQNLQAGEPSNIQLSWKAIGWQDELIPNYPKGYKEPYADPLSAAVGATSSLIKLF